MAKRGNKIQEEGGLEPPSPGNPPHSLEEKFSGEKRDSDTQSEVTLTVSWKLVVVLLVVE
jgi:hypothetical protein